MSFYNHKNRVIFAFFIFYTAFALAQKDSIKVEQPLFKIFREAEDYAYLKNNQQYQQDFFDPIKYIPLNSNGTIHASFGGQVRPRFEYFSNRFWEEDNDVSFYSQRLALHANIVLGKNFRIFTELYHGFNSGKKEIAQYDQVDIFQAFVDYYTQVSPENRLELRLGRQELNLGASRLVGIREGPNIRRSFDMVKLHFKSKKYNIQAFYGKEVFPTFNSFDNKSNLFDSDAVNPILWGIYSQFNIKGDIGKNEVYYLGFNANIVAFNDVQGKETRHTIGLRRFGKIGEKWRYNTELIYQFGDIENNTISAFSFATDAYYKFNNAPLLPELGLKLEYSSGDKQKGDDKIQSFNPMFVNPAHYSLAGSVTPINLISIHPSISAHIGKKLKVYMEWAVFWKNSSEDALYRPTRFINIPSNSIEDKGIGNQLGFSSSYKINRHLSFDIDMSYFIAGEYLKKNNKGNAIFHIAPTVNYKF